MGLFEKCIMGMNDSEYWTYMEKCEELTKLLSTAIDLLMNYIFLGRCQNSEQWETLFKAVGQAVFMRDHLKSYNSNLIGLAEDFLVQVKEWQQEIDTNVK